MAKTFVSGEVLTASDVNVYLATYMPMIPTSVAGSGVSYNTTTGLVTLTAASSASLNGVFVSPFTRFKIIASFNRSTSLNVSMRLRLSGTDNSAANYDRQLLLAAGASISGASTVNDTDWENFTGTGAGRIAADATIFEPNTTDFTQMMIETTSLGASYIKYGMIHDVATAFDGFSWITSTGNITGSLKVYGLA